MDRHSIALIAVSVMVVLLIALFKSVFNSVHKTKGTTMTKEQKTWTVQLQEDLENPEELFIELPQELIDSLEWAIGDEIAWNVEDNGSVTISKV